MGRPIRPSGNAVEEGFSRERVGPNVNPPKSDVMEVIECHRDVVEGIVDASDRAIALYHRYRFLLAVFLKFEPLYPLLMRHDHQLQAARCARKALLHSWR